MIAYLQEMQIGRSFVGCSGCCGIHDLSFGGPDERQNERYNPSRYYPEI